MFKHVLIPTDGSPLSNGMIHKALTLAKEQGAIVTAIHVMAGFHVFTASAEMLEDTRESYKRDSEAHAATFLAQVESAAREQGVVCKTLAVSDDQPYEAIVRAARELGCDLICMASHGRRGVKGLLLGSETQKVLTHSQIPVLVFR